MKNLIAAFLVMTVAVPAFATVTSAQPQCGDDKKGADTKGDKKDGDTKPKAPSSF